jgi:predicted permease
MLEQLRDALPERFPDAYSQGFFEGSGFRTRVVPLKQAVVGDLSTNLWVLFGGVGLVLLMAWANVSNLFLVRVDGRRQELAVRAALGAGRGALARYLLAEGLTLGVTGGVLAVLVSWWGVPTLAALAPDALPRLDAFVGIGGETVAFALIVSFIVGTALAAVPLVRHSRVFLLPSAVVGRSIGSSPGRQKARSALVMAQVALALTLVSGAGLMLESVRRLASIDPGMDPAGVVTASIYLTPSRFGTSTEKWTAYRDIITRVESVPGVVAAGMSAELPADGGFGCTVQGFEEQAVYDRLSELGLSTCAGQEPTTPGYFEAARIPILRGRSFEMGDNDSPGSGAVVVSDAFADRFWPGEDPIGKGVAPNGRRDEPYYRVVGVVGDVPRRSLDGETAMAIYYPMVSHPDTPGTWDPLSADWMHLVVRTESTDPLSAFPDIRRAIQSVDPTIPVDGVRTMDALLAESVARFTFTSILLTVAASVALGLAAVGLFGVVSYVVGQRRREIGMRIAIGANPSQVQRLLVLRSAPPILIGLALGVGLAVLSGRVMEGLLYDVRPSDPIALAAAATVLGGVAALASWIPARRASRVDPSIALRVE